MTAHRVSHPITGDRIQEGDESADPVLGIVTVVWWQRADHDR